jgi:phenylpropionate dioxygenase-like ring-hydroxylating dioxygenase large terminal subunit
MTRPQKFLTVPYGGYLKPAETWHDEQLTRVGRGTPAGEYLRRFWHPVALSAELTDTPHRIRILGEDLVAFRDGRGRVGVLELHCSHRGTSLEYGIVSESGIRCCYHGWLFDVDGRILEIPSEPSTSTLKDRLFHGAYPALELNGIVFAYMGPPEKRPAFPIYDSYELDGYRHEPALSPVLPCNWLQVRENTMDPVHTSFLHTIVSGTQFTDEFGVIPELQWKETPIGMVYIASRRVGDKVWVRILDVMLPNIHQVPALWEDAREVRIRTRPIQTVWTVPVDDTNTRVFRMVHIDKQNEWGAQKHAQLRFGQHGGRPYKESQLRPGDYEAFVSQGALPDHSAEHLASSDRGVVMLRKLLKAGVRAVEEGKDPKGWLDESSTGVIPTYTQDTIMRIPPGATEEEDKRVMREVGLQVVDGIYSAGQEAAVT